jgi:ATP-dependent RNA helicase SUPV3L1/SUV3
MSPMNDRAAGPAVDKPGSLAPAPKPAPLPLPDARHAARLPPHIGRTEVERLQQAAYWLPQVVKPADYLAEGSAGFEAHLGKLGLILLQKSAGARPSRWIASGWIDAALAQLAAAGSGAAARPQMLERAARLQALGITRHAGVHSRLVRHVLVVPVPEAAPWRIAMPWQQTVADAPVWDFYRTGDEPALLATIGDTPTHPQAAELTAHLSMLVARSHAFQPPHLDALRVRLQAECDLPGVSHRDHADWKTAFTRAQDQWEHRVAELDALSVLNSELAFQRYPDTFPKARQLQRTVTLYVGPPNSGKTHAAFERLASVAQAGHGAYLAPLRLLALEGRDRLVARGVACSLLTGEENQPAEGARIVSSTIEMVATNQPIDIAVIDEAQMIFDASRGWAWTQAIVAVPANELIIICSDYAVPAIQSLLGLCGEKPVVRVFERKQHVELLSRPVGVDALQLGDAVVAFSRRDVLTLRDRISANGHPVSVIYGALPPEVRRREAERFATGESHVLVATDAIGMGLNLPIRRVLFSTVTKFDGRDDRLLSESEVHQIAGRAGRFGIHEEGFAGVLEGAEPTAARQLRELMHRHPKAPKDFKAPVAPNGWHVHTIAERLHSSRLREVLGVFVERLKLDDAHFAVAELEQMLELADALDRCAAKLTLRERFTYAQAPVDTRTDSQLQEFLDWSASHAATGRVGAPWFLDAVSGHSRLDRMEQALRACTLWLWLDLRFPDVYGRVDDVHALRGVLNDGIERQLKGKRPLVQERHRHGGRPGRSGPPGAPR